MIELPPQVFLLTLLLLLNIAVAAAKFSYINSRPERLRAGNTVNSLAALKLLENRNGLILNLQTSHVILRMLIAGMIASLAWVMASPGNFILVSSLAILLSGAVIAVMEQWLEIQIIPRPERWAVRLLAFTRLWLVLLSPILFFPRLISQLLFRQPQKLYRVTEEELGLILDAGERAGVLEVDERAMIDSIFQFRDTLAREIMIPRIDLLSLSFDTPILAAIDAMLESGYSRVPVYRGTVDHVVGVLYVKDLLRLYRAGDHDGTIEGRLRPPYFIPETKKVGDLLSEMQRERIHIAIVVDEYGGIAGIVTLEDIVEEIVGEIQDEHDDAEEELSEKISEDEYLFLGKIDIDEFNEIMGTDISRDDADTLGGILFSRFGRIPKSGDTISTDDILLTAEQVTGRRIRKVRVRRSQSSLSPEQAASHADN